MLDSYCHIMSINCGIPPSRLCRMREMQRPACRSSNEQSDAPGPVHILTQGNRNPGNRRRDTVFAIPRSSPGGSPYPVPNRQNCNPNPSSGCSSNLVPAQHYPSHSPTHQQIQPTRDCHSADLVPNHCHPSRSTSHPRLPPPSLQPLIQNPNLTNHRSQTPTPTRSY